MACMANDEIPAIRVVTGGTPPPAEGALWVSVDGRRCTTREGLFVELARALDFPDYFHHNWGSFDECVHDLEWLDAEAVILEIQHADELGTEDPGSRLVFTSTLGQRSAAYRSGFLTVWLRSAA